MKQTKRLILLNTVFAGSVSCFSLISETLFLDEWKKVSELKRDEKVISLPQRLHDLIIRVSNEMKLSQKEKLLIKPYLTKRLDIEHYGYANAAPGAILGVPQYFLFDNKTPVNVHSVINNFELSPETPESQTLKNAFFLSEEAKKFGIARQINESKNNSFIPLALLPVSLALGINALFYFVIRNPHSKTYRWPSIFHSQMLLFGIGLYFIVHDVLTVHREADADFKAADLGNSYIEGGIEYYEKMIQRNKLIKQLDDHAPFTKDGDINISWIRTIHMPLPRRLIYLKDLKNASEKKERKPSAWDYVMLREILQK